LLHSVTGHAVTVASFSVVLLFVCGLAHVEHRRGNGIVYWCGCAQLWVLQDEWVHSSVMARAAQIAQIIIWAVILVLGVLVYWRYLRLAPMD
jgi:uncharacterized membrane protein